MVAAEVGEPDSASGELQSVARMHALFNTPIEAFESALRAVAEQDDYLPRLEESILLCSSGTPMEYGRVRQKLSFRLLFFGKDYEYELHYFFDDSVRGEFLVWWQLAEALDGQIEHTDGVWYFKEVFIQGTNYTYMTYATRTVFRKETLGLRAAIERFGERDVRDAMIALNEEARRRLR